MVEQFLEMIRGLPIKLLGAQAHSIVPVVLIVCLVEAVDILLLGLYRAYGQLQELVALLFRHVFCLDALLKPLQEFLLQGVGLVAELLDEPVE